MARKKHTYTIGIDLGGTKILTAVVDEQGKVVAAVKELTQAQEGAKAVIERIKHTLDTVLEKAKLTKKDIEGIGIGVHYPVLHLFTYYRQLGYTEGMYPHAEHIGASTITLPLFPAMEVADVERVCIALREVISASLN